MRAKKSLGQNFLRDKSAIKRIVDSLDLRGDEAVIEIGPGQGALTERLLEKAASVIAIEFDRDLVPRLRDRFSENNLKLFNADALNVDFAQFAAADLKSEISHLKLAANLPYNISTPILQRLIEQRQFFSTMVLMFQREVVERITAKPGGRDRGYLSVLVENAFDAEYLFDVPPEAFQPIPRVWSAVVRLTPKEASIADDEGVFRNIVSISFAQKRKTILNNLKTRFEQAAIALEDSDINGRRRAESLTLEEWARLTASIKKMPGT
jgi:16S rRNA (adenine1518-N6/adenine1519-N6)-dimethyltransferase